MTTLRIENLTRRFSGQTVLRDVSLEVPSGSTLVLFGPSGAGKTVLLRLIAGALEPDAGRILIGGRDMAGVPPEERGVGMAFQNFALFPHMSAFDNIAAPLVARGVPGARVREAVEAVARLLKIDHVLAHPPRALSNGQKQRTALARALVAEPALLLLDDPLRNVDAKLRFEMRLELPRLLSGRGATVVHVTQDYREAMALGDRIAVLDEGRIMQEGSPADIYLRPATIGIAQLFGDPAVNLLDVVPAADEGVHVALSGRRLSLDPGYAHAAGRACVLGLRPEAIGFAPDPAAPDAVPVTVEAETPLNEKIVTLVVTAGGREILVSRPLGTPGPAMGPAAIRIDSARALLFDRATGRRIAPGRSAPAEAAA
ncbi:MAG: ABC transporter ATP-binding protein [Alphaproteobacteria bacterium]|nr:MAG: ABC transporter ATP-binding protein [Alphaproteobacteria bacterium]